MDDIKKLSSLNSLSDIEKINTDHIFEGLEGKTVLDEDSTQIMDESIFEGLERGAVLDSESVQVMDERIFADLEPKTVLETAEVIDENMFRGLDPDIFLISVQNMTERDITLNETVKNIPKKSVDFVRYFVLLICLGVFVYSGYNIVEKLFSYAEAANDYNAIRGIFYGTDAEPDLQGVQELKKTKKNIPIKDILYLQKHSGSQTVEAEVSEGVREIDQLRAKLELCKNINPDTYGWLKVSGTTIDYPVVQGTDDYYYLGHNFYQKTVFAGAIFCDHRNDKDVSKNLNTIIYGHNMADQSMFSTLTVYGIKEDVFNSGIIELGTEDGIYRYQVFTAHIEVSTYPYIEVSFGPLDLGYRYASIVDFAYDMRSRSSPFRRDDIQITPESKLITLSTCTNWGDRRFVVQGVLIEVIK